MIRKTRTGDYVFYDIAPKTTDGRTFDGEDALARTRQLATTLLVSRGASPHEAAEVFNCCTSLAYRNSQQVCETAGHEGKFPRTDKPITEIRDECIKIMYSCDYTILDLSETWMLNQNSIREIIGEHADT